MNLVNDDKSTFNVVFAEVTLEDRNISWDECCKNQKEKINSDIKMDKLVFPLTVQKWSPII